MDAHGDPNGAGQAAHAETCGLSPCQGENGHAKRSGGRGIRQESKSRSPRRRRLRRSRDALSKTRSPTPVSRIGCRRRSAGTGDGERERPAAAYMPRKGLLRSFAVAAKWLRVLTLPFESLSWIFPTDYSKLPVTPWKPFIACFHSHFITRAA